MASDDPAVAECLGGVVAVVVTWNRREVLTRCLDAVLGQTHRPSRVVIVDNDSDDGTASVLAERYAALPNVQIVRTVENIGGAGGFALGLEFALGGAGETAWLLDDDTVPTPGALEALVGARTAYQQSTGTTPVLVASRAVWTDGREHPMNTPRRKPGASAAETSAAAAVGCVAIRTASFVSILVDLERTREVGLPEAGFFLWNDDFEFTARLARGRRALYCRASTVVHETKKFGGTDADPGPRFHLEVRNKVWTFGRSRGLSAPEKVLYGGATARRWARTIWRSTDRPTLLRGLGQGLRAGLTGAPAPTSVVLTEALGAGAETGAGARQMTPRREDGFAVLMSVYARDRADFFEDAFRSVTVDQTLPPDQVVLVVDGPLPPALHARVEAVVGERAHLAYSGAHGLAEITGPGVTKAAGLARWAGARGIGSADVWAFGDMPNDLPMLRWAGRSYAVSNAHPDVLAAASHRCPANSEDGVAWALEALVGRREPTP